MMGPDFLCSTGLFPFSKVNRRVIVTDMFLDPNLRRLDCYTVVFRFQKCVPLFHGGTTRQALEIFGVCLVQVKSWSKQQKNESNHRQISLWNIFDRSDLHQIIPDSVLPDALWWPPRIITCLQAQGGSLFWWKNSQQNLWLKPLLPLRVAVSKLQSWEFSCLDNGRW